jgi:hypothetical protein
MIRLTDPQRCREITNKYPDYFTFDAPWWFAQPGHYAFLEGENVGFGEERSPGVFHVHFCFHEARGREAIELTKRMFKELCSVAPLKTAVGIIETRNKRARWLIRQVGFKSLGLIETKDGECEMFYSRAM